MPLKVDSHAELEPALKKAYEMMSDSQAGARSGVPKVLIILTASFNNETGKEMDYVRKLQQLGTSLISIGTGSSINPILLFQLPRNPSNSILIEDFNKLTDREQSENVVKRILKASEFRCFSEVDVGFILDSSGSLRNSYDKEKELLKRIAGTFVIGQNQARMSVVTFSYHASLSIKFSDYDGETDFFQAVDNIPLMGYTTRIDKALEMAKDSMFNEKNGARVGVPKILILLTDGSQSPSSDATDPAVLAKKIRNTGINLLAIGIGKGINQTELEHIVGSSQSTFQAASFDEITTSNFITKVASGSCRKAKEPPKPSCEAVVDVGFILDSSGSLRNEYGKEKNFLKSMATTFGISENGSRAGVVTFSYYTEHSIKLSDYTDLARFNEAVDRIPLMGRTTRIDKALRVAQKDLFSISNGGRPGVPKILILLTDGSQTPDADAEEPGDIADELRKQGITILVVGIGSGVNSTELAHIAGKTDNVFSAASFDQLVGNEFVDKIKEGGCAAGEFFNRTTCKRSQTHSVLSEGLSHCRLWT
ncbi:collagen alpha-5(VI) chain-like isoform X2 [Hydractinia symbiolongicarpus]|nr:collagen alpha-5(VI) chain-like isoform X2 [Hydractinia symbiolongicarpus]